MKLSILPTAHLFSFNYLLLLCLFGIAPSAIAVTSHDKSLTKENAHKVCVNTIKSMAKVEGPVVDFIERNDIKALREKLLELESGVKIAQSSLDKALLVGAWSKASYKHDAHLIADRMETLKILNFIGIAITSSYYANKAALVDRHSQRIAKRNASDIYATVYANVIPPSTSDIARYKFKVPDNAQGKLTIRPGLPPIAPGLQSPRREYP